VVFGNQKLRIKKEGEFISGGTLRASKGPITVEADKPFL